MFIGGGLSVKLLKRTAQFGSGEKPVGQKIQPHNIKLLVPKKSKLFVEQTLREREQCCGRLFTTDILSVIYLYKTILNS